MKRSDRTTTIELLWIALAVLVLPTAAGAQDAYAGVWRGGDDAYALWVGADWDDFVSTWETNAAAGLRLTDLETYLENGERLFNGVWREGSDAYFLWVGADWESFVSTWQANADVGLRLIDLETYLEDGERRFAGVWREGSDAYSLWVGADWDGFVAKWQENDVAGLRLIDLEIYVENGEHRFLGVWRAGSDAHILWVGADWAELVSKWQEYAAMGLRLIDLETYVEGGERRFAGVWREGSDAYGLWVGADFENLVARWHAWAQDGLRLVDLERYPGCSASCANQVVAPDSYNYLITGGDLTEGETTDVGWHRWPVVSDAAGDFVRLSAVHFSVPPFLALPFSDLEVFRGGTWRYADGGWHHAIDYARPGEATFAVRASAPGVVVYQRWDTWLGHTVIVSHTVAGESDGFRTLYSHLRNGASNDCQASWEQSVPTLSGQIRSEFEQHLNDTGCTVTAAGRNLDAAHWGTEAEAMPDLVGQTVSEGDLLAWAGNTGPGGKRGPGSPNTHLHLFVTRRDPTDGKHYFIDPYGIYARPSCYPNALGGSVSGPCGRYPNIWKPGDLIFASGFESGDLTDWSP